MQYGCQKLTSQKWYLEGWSISSFPKKIQTFSRLPYSKTFLAKIDIFHDFFHPIDVNEVHIQKYEKDFCYLILQLQDLLQNSTICGWSSLVSENHLSILKWSLSKYWSWKVWTLSFQMPCRTHFSEPWMWRSIISNEKVSYLHLKVALKHPYMQNFVKIR